MTITEIMQHITQEPYFIDTNSAGDVIGVLYCADCLEILPQMPEGCVSFAITDPPYSSGGQFRGDRTQAVTAKYIQTESIDTCRKSFSGDNRDQRSFLMWASLWMMQLFRISGDGACFLCFTDWRQLPTMTDAIQCGGWVWRNIITWWKPGIRMQRGRPSASAEYVLYGSSGVPNPGEHSPQNVLKIKPQNGSDKQHLAEKPLELLTCLTGLSVVGAIVIDPFAGAGTSLVAAKQMGRAYCGIEIEERYCAIAKQRLLQMELF